MQTSKCTQAGSTYKVDKRGDLENGIDMHRFKLFYQCLFQVDRDNPHDHYPRPQLVREQWRSLNGQWDFQIISEDEAWPEEFSDKITVPFCVESELSGVRREVGPDQRMIYRRSDKFYES